MFDRLIKTKNRTKLDENELIVFLYVNEKNI